MAGLDALVVGRQHHPVTRLVGVRARRAGVEQRLALGLGVLEMAQQRLGVGELEIVPGIFLLGLQEDLAVADLAVALEAVEVQVVDVVDALDIHGQTLQPVGQLAGDGRAFDAADLLEIGELRHFHAVAPALPAEAPGAERRAFPVVLDEADVVQQRVDADRRERAEIELLQVRRVGLQDDLVLVVVLQAVGVLAVAAVLGPARGLDVGGVPRLRPERAQGGGGVEGAGADLHVVGLQHQAAVTRPIVVQRQDQPLEGTLGVEMRKCGGHGDASVDRSASPREALPKGQGERRGRAAPEGAQSARSGSLSSCPALMRAGSPLSCGFRSRISR